MKPHSTTLRAALVAIGLVIALGGCTHNRSMGTVVDDHTIEMRVIDAIYAAPDIGQESHIKVESHNRTVLLMGETDTAAKRTKAETLAAGVFNVERVVNEIVVAERADIGTRTNNSWLTAKVSTRLMTDDSLPGFDMDRVKVITSAGTVYLMGDISRDEAKAVTEIVRNIGGVDKVVTVFDYTD
ncbi:BON domain-containing protein [Marinihelvus fidelis]|uniref:BON domain-containing protein n=2 Tax=Marinihelvus fidelis TaxID=2613842 RepID=A0A5N0T5H2_9GAMM|nr:BON domain-containing protein [Marinihelvus fidelis]